MTIAEITANPRLVFALLLGASAAILAAAFASQYIAGLEPCVLCLYQRVPYGAVIALSGLGLGLSGLAPTPKGVIASLAGLCAVAFLVNAGIATFHVGVEQHWWQGSEACGAVGTMARTIEELRAQILAAPVVRCDEVPWSLFGISMAGYNVLASLGLFVASAIAARGMWRAGGDRADA
jgi:disulfide bond formation protein DsbB